MSSTHFFFFFFNDTATTEIYTLSLHDALPICVHDWPTDNWDGKNIPAELSKLAHDSSPVTSVNTWKSPVLFIHGDDDRNVYFTQTVDLVARLREKGVQIEQLVFPDDVHDFLLHKNWLAAYHAASDFFDRHFKTPGN